MGNKKESEKKKNPKSLPPKKTTTTNPSRPTVGVPPYQYIPGVGRCVCAPGNHQLDFLYYHIISYILLYHWNRIVYVHLSISKGYRHAIVNFSKPFSTPPHPPPPTLFSVPPWQSSTSREKPLPTQNSFVIASSFHSGGKTAPNKWNWKKNKKNFSIKKVEIEFLFCFFGCCTLKIG